MKKLIKRTAAFFLATAVMASSYATGVLPGNIQVEAQQRPGTAPYINTWLVAGPSEESVIDKIYGEAPLVRPENGNWASVAEVSASSSWKTTANDFPEGTDEAKNVPAKAVDGDKSTCWLSQMHDNWIHDGDPAYWPEWDPAPTYYLTWKQPIKVKTVDFYNRYDPSWGDQVISQIQEVKVTLKDASGKIVGEKTVTDIDPKGNEPGRAEFDSAVEGVSSVELLIVHDGVKELRNVGLGFSEVEVYDGDATGDTELGEAEELRHVSTEASSVLNNDANYGAEKALDDDPDTYWSSNTQQGIVWDPQEIPKLTVELEQPSTVTELKFVAHERDGKKVDFLYQMIHKTGSTIASGKLENVVPGEEYTLTLDKPVANVQKIIFSPCQRTDEGNVAPNHLGFNEVEAWGVPGETGSGDPEPMGNISPVLGEDFGDTQWQYFDDRIFNRNTDDWQDLSGYFTVKQGLETSGKYVYAHTYVYSDKEQDAQLRFVTSGLHKVYVNDMLVDQNSTAVESSNKDQYIRTIHLKQGWNKVMLEIKHERTSYVGFYARITTTANGADANSPGDLLEGITCSVIGPHTQDNQLSVATQGLDIDKEAFDQRNAEAGIESNMYPDNELPNGYVQWPYVWNKAIHKVNESYATQASKFQFEAAGGTPGYTWEIIEGKLPDGLTLLEDGQIDGYCTTEGEYPFTIQVTDAEGNTAIKKTSITVKERPNKWFEEGKMSALSHNTGGYSQNFDPNFSFDMWAERAKEAGMTMLSTEAVQGIYFWPAPGSFPGDPNGAAERQHPNTTEVVNGVRQPKDMVGQVKEAAERHGLRFGVYYASEGSNRIVDSRVNCSSGFYMNVEDLMKRYDPSYLFFDGGPQGKGNADAMWSAVRAYNDYALIQANDQNEVSDNDLTILETEYIGSTPYTQGGYWETNNLMQNKYTVNEWWTHPCVKAVQGWALRDDWRLFAEYIVYCIGHGSVANYDQMIVSNRGVDWNGIRYDAGTKDSYYYWPQNAQEFIELRDNLNAWMANEGGPDLHESLFGTMPYYFDTYEKKEGWHENTEKEPFLTAKYGEGPDWGYSVSRDQYVYMHMTENTIGNGRAKKGFTGQESIYVGPFDYDVTKVEWLNKGQELNFTPSEKDGKKYITIDTSSVETDPIDTIIKITTADPTREYQLTSVKLYSSQETSDALQLRAEAYLNDFTSVFADADLTYSSDNESVAVVDQNGLVTPVAEGKTTIRVSAAYEGKTEEDTYQVQVKADGSIAPAEELIGVVLRTDGKETFGEFSSTYSLPITFEGRTEKGGGTNILSYDDITWHYGVCSGQTSGEPEEADGYWHAREVEETDVLEVVDDKVIFNGAVSQEENIAIWADITIDGQTFTTNMNYLRIYPEDVLSNGAEVEASSGDNAEQVVDGVINSADGGNTSKWTPAADDENPSLTIKLNSIGEVNSVTAYFNNKDRTYMNTPKAIKIEVSENGHDWITTVEDGSVPNTNTSYAYEDDMYTYAVNQKAQYIRITFPGGASEEVMDVLEIQVNGVDISNLLSDLEVEPEQIDDQTANLTITGYSGTVSQMDLSDAKISVTSDAEDIIRINEQNQLVAVSTGRAKITVDVTLNGRKASESLYADVDADGKLYFGDYLKEVQITLDEDTVAVGDPVAVEIQGILNTGKTADMSQAQVEYIFSEDAPVEKMDGADLIYMPTEIGRSQEVTLQVTVTIDGISVTSEEIKFTAQGNNIAADAKVKVSSVRDRNGVPDGDNQDDRYLAEKAIDGDMSTHWAAKQSDISPWIQLTYDEEKTISQIVLYERGHQVNEIGEGLLEFFDLEGNLVHSQMVTDIQWDGQPANEIKLENPVTASSVKFTIDPEEKYHHSGSERGLAEIQVLCETSSETKIEAVQPVYVETKAGTVPELPETVTAVYSDTTTGEVEVTWEEITEDMVSEPGIVMVEGSITGTEKKAKAWITVTSVPANKYLLEKTYEYALEQDIDNLIDTVKAYYEEALSQGKDVLLDTNATQAEVDAATDKLLNAIWMLDFVKGDKTNLGILIERAENMVSNVEKYVQGDIWQQLMDALDEAKTVYNDGDAMESDIQPVADKLLQAILAQRYKADKSILEDLINKANEIDLSQYTEESVQLFKSALKAANAVLKDETLGEDEQSTVDNAVTNLENAIDGLEKLSSGNDNSDNTDKDNNDGNDTSKDPNKGQVDDNSGKTPTTGDTTNLTFGFMLVVLSLVAVVLATGYRRKNIFKF